MKLLQRGGVEKPGSSGSSGGQAPPGLASGTSHIFSGSQMN